MWTLDLFIRGHRPKKEREGKGEILNSTWTSQFVFKNLISFQRITFRTHRKLIFDHKSA